MLTYNLQRTLIPSIAVYFQKEDVLTTGTGAPVGLKTATMTVGPRGPVLLQDFVFTDEMAHFNRERIPERVVHAKGAGQSIQYYLSPSLSSLVFVSSLMCSLICTCIIWCMSIEFVKVNFY